MKEFLHAVSIQKYLKLLNKNKSFVSVDSRLEATFSQRERLQIEQLCFKRQLLIQAVAFLYEQQLSYKSCTRYSFFFFHLFIYFLLLCCRTISSVRMAIQPAPPKQPRSIAFPAPLILCFMYLHILGKGAALFLLCCKVTAASSERQPH